MGYMELLEKEVQELYMVFISCNFCFNILRVGCTVIEEHHDVKQVVDTGIVLQNSLNCEDVLLKNFSK
jgi:hypothetical protein